MALLRRLSQVEGFEQYLRRSFLGQKQFSLEGLDVLDPDARRGDRARGGGRRARGRDRHGAPRPAQRARPHGRPLVRVDAPRVRGRALVRRARRRPGGRERRREVPPPGLRDARHGERARSRSRSRRTRATSRPSTRSSRAGRAPSRPTARAAQGCTTRRSRSRADPRRRGVPRPGRRCGDAQPAEPRGLLDRAARCT